MTFTIRAARPGELEAVGELTVRAYVGGGHLAGGSSYEQRLRDAADRAEKAELLVAVDGEQVLGSVTLARSGEEYADIVEPGELEFRMLAVAPEASGRGVGQALVQAVIDRARVEGMWCVALSTQESMTAAHSIYRKLGFQRTPARDWEPVPGLKLQTYGLELRSR